MDNTVAITLEIAAVGMRQFGIPPAAALLGGKTEAA
jgi:hypothetical protein